MTTDRDVTGWRPLRFAGIGGILFALVALAAGMPHAQVGVTSPGALSDGTTLLPSGWRITPAGRNVAVGDLPLNIVESPDGKYLVVTNNGLAKPSLSVVDVTSWAVTSTTPLANAWLGLVFSPDGRRLYSAAAAQNAIQEFSFVSGVLTPQRTLALPAVTQPFASGLAMSHDGRTLYVTQLFAATVTALDVASGQVKATASLPAEPYTAVVANDDRSIYVSVWGGAEVVQLSADALLVAGEYVTGEHPNSLALSKDGLRLFVACGSNSEVWVLDAATGEAIERLSVALYPEAPPTATPNALALSPDGRTLAVANADDNAVAMVDVSNGGRSFVDGFVPTGWYPTGVLFGPDGKLLFVLDGHGLAPAANPGNNNLDKRLAGAVSAILVPDRTALADYTRRVYAVTPYNDTIRLTPAGAPIGSPVPGQVGRPSPIRHVFYVIRENRSYDQVLGDQSAGNGDPKLVLFGRATTPNAHALSDAFVLFDNFYVDADVSYSGHSFSTAAYATDFIRKVWQANYGGRGAPYLGEGGGLLRNPFGNITAPAGGYLWDAAARAGVTYRSYGEFVHNVTKTAAGDVTVRESVPGLAGAISTTFAGFDLDITDNRRIDVWEAEFRACEKNNTLPQLSIIRLGDDHTQGSKAGAPTPRAMVAENDLAVGRLVEIVSNSAYWKDSAIFILEDDAQNGPDHVDSHRSVLLVASPFARRGFVDHTLYTTSGVLRTIELILGLPPMSEYDAAATPLYNAFQPTANLLAFRRMAPSVPIDEKNAPSAYGAVESSAMDFSDADRAPELLLNEIVWRSIKGARSPVPPPLRSVLVRPPGRAGDDDDQ